jgi:hypothetical protein
MEYPISRRLCSLEYQIMDKVKKPVFPSMINVNSQNSGKAHWLFNNLTTSANMALSVSYDKLTIQLSSIPHETEQT